MKSVHAFTEEVDSYPGFMSIVREDLGPYRIAVHSRGRNGNSVSSMVCDRQHLRQLASALLRELGPVELPTLPKLVPEDVQHAGQMMSNVCLNWKQQVGRTITPFDATMLATLQGNWDAAVAGAMGSVTYWKYQAEALRTERDELRMAAHTVGAPNHG